MSGAFSIFNAQSDRIAIRRPKLSDCDAFLDMTLNSQALHHPWVAPATTREAFEAYLETRQLSDQDGYLLFERERYQLIGVVNLNCIVRGSFDSAYLGYYANARFANRGLMTDGLRLVIQHAFKALKLHRLEANIQPANANSIALVRRLGFLKEGFSPNYLRIAGEWRDHERWAIRCE